MGTAETSTARAACHASQTPCITIQNSEADTPPIASIEALLQVLKSSK